MELKITQEAAQDLRAIISEMSDTQMIEFITNTLRANDATKLTLTKEVVMEETGPRSSYTMNLIPKE